MSKLISDQDLQKQVEGLGAELTPNRDLWPGIEKALTKQVIDQQEQQSEAKAWSLKQVMPIAASFFVAAILLSVLLPSQQNNVSEHTQLVQSIESNFSQQKQAMLVSFGQPDLAKLPVDMQNQLKQLSNAQKSLIKAIEADPNNVELLDLLRWTQTQELTLLEQLYSPQWQTI